MNRTGAPEWNQYLYFGKQNRGYVANVTEAAGENGSIVTDYQYEKNTHSDSRFMKDCLEKEERKVLQIHAGLC